MRSKNNGIDALIIFFLYFAPIVVWCWVFPAPPSTQWLSLSGGIVLAAIGSIFLFYHFHQRASIAVPNYEPIIPESPPIIAPLPDYPDLSEPLAEITAQKSQLEQEVEVLKQEVSLQKHLKQSDIESKEQELLRIKEQLEEKEKYLKEHVHLIEEQSTKLRELEYEIKTLVDIKQSELEEDPFIHETDALELSQLLKEKLEKASPSSNLEQLIKNHSSATVFVYHLQNQTTLACSGATPEINKEDLPDLFPTQSLKWHEAILNLEQNKPASITLNNGTELILSPITRGPYEGLILGVSYF